MNIYSMTGYAINTTETVGGTLTIELKGVNSRFLDLQYRLPDTLYGVEPLLREAMAARLTRGKVECRISVGRKATHGAAPVLNATLLASLAKLQADMAQQFAQARPLSMNDLLRWPGVLEEAQVDQQIWQTEIAAALSNTLDAFIDSRAREGAALRNVILTCVGEMESVVTRIAPLAPQAVQQFQQKAVERMQEVFGLAAQNGAPTTALSREEALERVRQEVTLYGIRIDIAEELARLTTHISETRRILEKGGQVGKRLDFMMQELNREANTLGSKAAVRELADASMALKLSIEQMREQVQNLE